MLPTVIFILGVYLLYALCRIWSRRPAGRLSIQTRRRRGRWLTPAIGTVMVVGLIMGLSLWNTPSSNDNLKLGEIVFTGGWGEGWAADQANYRHEYLPLRAQVSAGQPTYALLHPETPATQLLPDQPSAAQRPLRKPRPRKLAAPKTKRAKGAHSPVKKDKLAGKSRVKKKKPASLSANQKHTTG